MLEPEIILTPKCFNLFNNFRESNLLNYLTIVLLRRSKNFTMNILKKIIARS